MSMSLGVVGFKKPDAKWKKMVAIYDACIDAGEEIPENVNDYFNNEPPDKAGVTVDLEDEECCSDYNDEEACASGYEIDLSRLPKGVTIIRVYIS